MYILTLHMALIKFRIGLHNSFNLAESSNDIIGLNGF